MRSATEFGAGNGVRTLSDDLKAWEQEENQQRLEDREARKYRELVASANYLAQGRIDIQFAVKQVCRGMCSRTPGDLTKLRRLGR